jgi:hypothetical protein
MTRVRIINCFAGSKATLLPDEIHEFTDEAAQAQAEAGNVEILSTPDVETADDPRAKRREKR